MIRTQVFFTDEQMKYIKLHARLTRKSEAQVIRDLVEEGLKAKQTEKGETAGNSLLRLAKIGAKGPADLSEKIDTYL